MSEQDLPPDYVFKVKVEGSLLTYYPLHSQYRDYKIRCHDQGIRILTKKGETAYSGRQYFLLKRKRFLFLGIGWQVISVFDSFDEAKNAMEVHFVQCFSVEFKPLSLR